MAKFRCEFCQITLTSDSASARAHHFQGKAHAASCRAYWEKVHASLPKTYDQSEEIRHIWTVPGLTESLVDGKVQAALDEAKIVEPEFIR